MNAVIYGFGCVVAAIFILNFIVAMMQKGLAGIFALGVASFFVSLWMFS